MAKMNFGRGPGESANPTGMVIRTVDDGTLDVSVTDGDDPNVLKASRVIAARLAEFGAVALADAVRKGFATEHADDTGSSPADS